MITRMENGKELRFRFNYKDVLRGKSLDRTLLKPNDTVIVR